ncbi:hypothetical protein [Hyphomonas sp.]|uniref:hypothetical protein n=1 Tax=Hyphomonas sp. TaxID=87 RepID=UPI003D2DD1F3
MRTVFTGVLASSLLLSGCGTLRQAGADGEGVLGGPNADLRIILDDCGNQRAIDSAIALKFGAGLLKTVGKTSLRAFGDYIEEQGKEKTTTAVAVSSEFFYLVSEAEDGAIMFDVNPAIRCIHIVRAGHGVPGAVEAPTSSMTDTWTRLGIRRTPDLYASFRLETAYESISAATKAAEAARLSISSEDDDDRLDLPMDAEDTDASAAAIEYTGDTTSAGQLSGILEGQRTLTKDNGAAGRDEASSVAARPDYFQGYTLAAQVPPFFRLKLEDLYVDGFQSPGSAENSRDFALVFNFGSASAPQIFTETGSSAGLSTTNYFALGGVRVPGLRKGHFGKNGANGLVTAWMHLPGIEETNSYGLFNLTVHTLETNPGNPVMEAVGQYLSSDETLGLVDQAVDGFVDPDGTVRDTRITDTYQRIREDRTEVRELESRNALLQAALDNKNSNSADIKSTREAVEDKLLDVLERRSRNGGLAELDANSVVATSETLIAEARSWEPKASEVAE